MGRDIGPDGLSLLKNFEKLALTAYRDQGGIWTIGWGHTGPDVHPNMTCNLAEANLWLSQDVASSCHAVNQSLLPEIAPKLSQSQFDALVCFTFNVGVGAEAHSTLLKLVNAGNLLAAAAEFPKWNHVDGQVSAGLTRRRAAEQTLFLAPSASI